MNSHERATIRKCSKCGAETENFSKKSVWCKSCVSTYDKEIYQRKRAKILEQKKDYRKKNKSKVAQANNEWRKKNSAKIKLYLSQYSKENAQAISEKKKSYYEKNKDKILEQKRAYHEANRKDILLAKKRYYNNPKNYALFAFHREKRRARIGLATPSWASKEEIMKMYERSKIVSAESGILHHVDHVIPLFGVEVCGLNVHTNMRVIPAKENHKKSNKLIEDIV